VCASDDGNRDQAVGQENPMVRRRSALNANDSEQRAPLQVAVAF
jgi:hypothetical protein